MANRLQLYVRRVWAGFVPASPDGISRSALRDPLIFPYEINKTKTFLKQRLALESLQGGAL